MDRCTEDALVGVVLAEVVPALGCTEPIAIALAAAKARQLLGAEPDRVILTCSGNIVKNARSVVVPRSGGRAGLEVACAMGVVAGDPDAGLECLERATDADAEAAGDLATSGRIEVRLAEGVAGLFIDVVATAREHEARAVLRGTHTRFDTLRLDDAVLLAAGEDVEPVDTVPDGTFTMANLVELADTIDLAARPELVERLKRQLDDNTRIADEGLRGGWGAEIGRTLTLTRVDDVATRARATAAAGSDARMSGCALPVMINSGSGNQGLTVALPVLAYARELHASDDDLLRALLLANLVALFQKRLIGRLSAFCGAVSAAAGAAAGIARLKGLDADGIGAAVVNTIATSGGIVCDGAKPSCASKISVAVENACCGVDLAERGITFQPGDGLVGATVEDTIRNIGRVAHDGMAGTDVEILTVMLEHPRP